MKNRIILIVLILMTSCAFTSKKVPKKEIVVIPRKEKIMLCIERFIALDTMAASSHRICANIFKRIR